MNTKIYKVSKRGFTLVELLIVIAILAVLSTAAVLVLNPAELLKQSRDATRISDLSTLNSAMGLYLADFTSGTALKCGNNPASTPVATASSSYNPFKLNNSMTGFVKFSSSTAIDGSGWVSGVNFKIISLGSPLSRLPIDPINKGSLNGVNPTSTQYFYAYTCDAGKGVYEFNANMESAKYKSNGVSDVESNGEDGGTNNDWYEIGSALDLDIQ